VIRFSCFSLSKSVYAVCAPN